VEQFISCIFSFNYTSIRVMICLKSNCKGSMHFHLLVINNNTVMYFVFQIFSPCSREYIFKVVKVKGYDCFIGKRTCSLGDNAFFLHLFAKTVLIIILI